MRYLAILLLTLVPTVVLAQDDRYPPQAPPIQEPVDPFSKDFERSKESIKSEQKFKAAQQLAINLKREADVRGTAMVVFVNTPGRSLATSYAQPYTTLSFDNNHSPRVYVYTRGKSATLTGNATDQDIYNAIDRLRGVQAAPVQHYPQYQYRPQQFAPTGGFGGGGFGRGGGGSCGPGG